MFDLDDRTEMAIDFLRFYFDANEISKIPSLPARALAIEQSCWKILEAYFNEEEE